MQYMLLGCSNSCWLNIGRLFCVVAATQHALCRCLLNICHHYKPNLRDARTVIIEIVADICHTDASL